MPRERTLALTLFGFAFALRLIHVLCLVNLPLFDSPAMDAQLHTFWAWSLVEGGGLGPEPYFRAPLYPYVLAAFFGLFGQTFTGFLVVHLAQAVLGAATCTLLYDLVRRIYGLRAGVVAGVMAATYWVFIYFDGELLLPTLINFLNLTAFWCLRRGFEDHRRRMGWLAVAGAVFGLSAITRPNILLVVPFLIGWVGWSARRDRWPGAAAVTLAFAGCAALPVGLVTARNYVVGSDLVLVASQAGVNFYIGNNELSDGRTAVVPGTSPTWLGGYQDTIRIAEAAAGHRLRPSEVSRYWLERGLEFLRDHPAQAAALYWKKLRLLCNGSEDSNNQNIYFFARWSGFLGLPIFFSFWMLAPLGVAGLLLNPRDRWWLLFGGFVVLYLASFLPFFITARYRIPALPFLMIPAAVFLVRSWDAWRSGNRRRLVWPGILVVVLGALVQWNRTPVEGAAVDAPSDGHFTLGNAYLRRHELDAAAKHFELSSRYFEPYASRSLMQLGAIALEQGRSEQAEEQFRAAAKADRRLEPEIAAIRDRHRRQGSGRPR